MSNILYLACIYCLVFWFFWLSHVCLFFRVWTFRDLGFFIHLFHPLLWIVYGFYSFGVYQEITACTFINIKFHYYLYPLPRNITILEHCGSIHLLPKLHAIFMVYIISHYVRRVIMDLISQCSLNITQYYYFVCSLFFLAFQIFT